MRTGIIIGRKHGKKSFELISGPETPLPDQIEQMRSLMRDAHQGSHADYAEVRHIQTHGGGERNLRFRTPSEQKAHDAQQEKDARAHADHLASLEKPKAEQTEADSESKPEAKKKADGKKAAAGEWQ